MSAAEPLSVKPSTAAEMMDCTRAHVYQLIQRGTLRAHRIPNSRSLRIPMEDIRAALGLDQ